MTYLVGIQNFRGLEQRVLLYRDVFPFQGVRIKRFYCIQRYPHFRELEGWNKVVPLYTEVCILIGGLE